MADVFTVGASVPTVVPESAYGSLTVENLGPDSVYYRAGTSVNSSMNDGSLNSGGSLTMQTTTAFVAASSSARIVVTPTVPAAQVAGGLQASSVTPSALVNPSALDWSGDWRNAISGVIGNTIPYLADFDHNGGSPQATPSRIRGVTAPTRRSGRLSARIECHTGDTDGGNGTTGNDRTEITATTKQYVAGNEIWVAYSLFIPPNFPVPTGFMVLHQFFAQDLPNNPADSGGSPPFAIEMTTAGWFWITVRGGAITTGTGSSAPTNTGFYLAPASRGRWHDFLVHIRFATDATGLVEAWHREAGGEFQDNPDGSVSAPNVYTLTDKGNKVLQVYPEQGIYRNSTAATATIYNGGMWIRSSRQAAEAFWAGAHPVPDHSARFAPTPAPGKTWTFYDDFEDGWLDTSVWTADPSAIALGGEVLIGGKVDAGGNYAAVSLANTSIQGKRFILEVIDPGRGLGSGSTALVWDTNWHQFAGNPNGMTVGHGANTVPYDPKAHRFIAMREAAGTLYYEASPDGRTWTTIYSVASPANVATAAVLKFMYGWYGAAQTVPARFGMFAIEQ